jgi:flagellar capping protein FliD
VALGFEFDETGSLRFDRTVLNALDANQLSSVLSFLGSKDTGGFLQEADALLRSASEDNVGILYTERESLQTQIDRQDDQMESLAERLTLMEESLIEQMAATDALLAQLQQEADYLNNLFESMRIAQESYSG